MCEILALKDLLTNPTHKQRRITLAAELSARLPLQLVKVFKKKNGGPHAELVDRTTAWLGEG
jgi:hypothetical protein